MKRILLLVVFSFVFVQIGLYSQTWKAVADPNLYNSIFKIYFPVDDPNKIVVASDNIPINLVEGEISFYDHYAEINGKGYQVSTDKGKTFTKGYLDTWFVYAFAQDPHNPKLWLASIRNNGSNHIVISEDGGENWNLNSMRNTGSYNVIDIAVKNSKPTRYFAAAINTVDGLKTTIDTFKTATKSQNLMISSRDVEVSPLDSSIIFLAGDKVHQGGVFRSVDNGKSWIQSTKGIENLRIHTVMPSAYDKRYVICGADSITPQGSIGKGIYVSNDSGNTWSLVAAKNARVFSIVRHPSNPRFMVAACDTSGVWVSGCWGTGWEQFKDGFPDTASIRSVGFPNWETNDDGAVIYAGTYISGLWVTTNRIKTTVEEQSNNFSKITFLTCYPSPFSKSVNITWFNPKSQILNIDMKDLNGNTVYSFNEAVYNQGINSVVWNPEARISGGSYFVVISDGFNTVSEKIIYLR